MDMNYSFLSLRSKYRFKYGLEKEKLSCNKLERLKVAECLVPIKLNLRDQSGHKLSLLSLSFYFLFSQVCTLACCVLLSCFFVKDQ